MLADELRGFRMTLCYTVPVLAEVLHVDSRLLRDWESGAVPAPDWLDVAVKALVDARKQPSDDELLIANGTFASRRRMLELSKLRDSLAAEPPETPAQHRS